MTNQELQEAINSARAFLDRSADSSTLVYKAKQKTMEHLEVLETLQRNRAARWHRPGIRPGVIVQCLENRPGCKKILDGLCDCGEMK